MVLLASTPDFQPHVRLTVFLLFLVVALGAGVLAFLRRRTSRHTPRLAFVVTDGRGDEVLAYELINETDPPIDLLKVSTGVRALTGSDQVSLANRETLAAGTHLTVRVDREHLLGTLAEGYVLLWARFDDPSGVRWEAAYAPGTSDRHQIEPVGTSSPGRG